jgi:hypothetical protein
MGPASLSLRAMVPFGDQKGTRCNAAAAPATVSGESDAPARHWETGKASVRR